MIVLDASAWVDVLVTGAARDALEDKVIVPPHFDAEVVAALRSLSQRGVLTASSAESALDRHLRAPFVREFNTADVHAAWNWKESMSLADAWYAVLARRLGATWVTSDRRAAETATRLGVEVTVL